MSKEIEQVVDKSIEEMNLVKILSHGTDESGPHEETEQDSEKVSETETGQVQGYALTVKDEFIDKIIDICIKIRPESFLNFDKQESPMFCCSANEVIIIPDEHQLISAVDPK